MQVVTIQSNVWSKLPLSAQHALFGEDGQGPHHIEMWPYSPDSPQEIGSPRNIPIKKIEDILLELIQKQDGVSLHGRVMREEDVEPIASCVLEFDFNLSPERNIVFQSLS